MRLEFFQTNQAVFNGIKGQIGHPENKKTAIVYFF